MPRTADILPAHDIKRIVSDRLRKVKQNPGIGTYIPHETQLRFHKSKAKGKMFMGGNRAGKTVGGAAEAVFRLIGKHPYRDDLPAPPVRLRGVAVDEKRGINQIMIPELKKWIPASELINGNWQDSYSKSDKILTLRNGSTLDLMSYEQEVGKFQGTSRHYIWFDEEPPEDIYKECMARLIDTDGEYAITMTPLIEMSWTFNQLYEPASVGDLDSFEIFEAQTQDNPHINMEAFERLTQTMSAEERKTRSSGVYISHTGLVYGEVFTRHRNVLPNITRSSRFDILRSEWSHFQMMDHGYNNPAVFLFACYDADGRIIIYDEIYKDKTLIRDLAQMVHDKRIQHRIETQYVVGDPSITQKNAITGTSTQTEYAEAGIYIGEGNNRVSTGIERTQLLFADQQLMITSNCEFTLKEMFKYKWDRHLTKARDRKNKKEEPIKKDDHAMDAMRYGVMSRPKHYSLLDEKREAAIVAANPASDFDTEMLRKEVKQIDEFLGSEW